MQEEKGAFSGAKFFCEFQSVRIHDENGYMANAPDPTDVRPGQFRKIPGHATHAILRHTNYSGRTFSAQKKRGDEIVIKEYENEMLQNNVLSTLSTARLMMSCHFSVDGSTTCRNYTGRLSSFSFR